MDGCAKATKHNEACYARQRASEGFLAANVLVADSSEGSERGAKAQVHK
jgi:hypothetical protein